MSALLKRYTLPGLGGWCHVSWAFLCPFLSALGNTPVDKRRYVEITPIRPSPFHSPFPDPDKAGLPTERHTIRVFPMPLVFMGDSVIIVVTVIDRTISDLCLGPHLHLHMQALPGICETAALETTFVLVKPQTVLYLRL